MILDLNYLLALGVLSLFLGFASYRITRFLVIDILIEDSRHKLYSFLGRRSEKNGKLHFFWEKIFELTSCTWCAGFHVSWVVLALWTKTWPWDFGVAGWITVFAIAAVQGILHAIEPDDE